MRKLILFLLFIPLMLNAQTWQYVGLDGYRVEYVYAKGDTIWAGTVDSLYQRAIQYSFTGGRDWFKVSDTDTAFGGWLELAQVDPRSCRTIYAIDKKKRGLRSTDAGVSWNVLWDDLRPQPWPKKVKSILVSPHNEKLIFCIVGQVRTGGVLDDLYRSTDGGITWDFVGGYFASSSHGLDLQLAFDPVDTLKMYATGDASYDVRFYVSTDAGISWNYLSYCKALRILVIKRENRTDIFLHRFQLYRSIDGGINWVGPLGDIYTEILTIHPFNHDILFANAFTSTTIQKYKIYISTNGGENWQIIPGSEFLPLNFPDVDPQYSLIVDSITNRLFVGTNGKGLYMYDIHRLVSIKNEIAYPSGEFYLYQNYPNPFNSTTVISYELRYSDHVKLLVIDLFGREVAVLVDENQNSGNYSTALHGVGLKNGLYFYKMQVGNKIKIRKMCVLR